MSSKSDLCLLLVGCLKHCSLSVMHELAQKMPVFVKETTLQATVPSTAAELLTLYPDSPYTSFLVTSRGYISSLDQHCTRLSSGLTRLRSARNGAARDLTSDGKPNGPADRDVGPAYDLLSVYKESQHHLYVTLRSPIRPSDSGTESSSLFNWQCLLATCKRRIGRQQFLSWSPL